MTGDEAGAEPPPFRPVGEELIHRGVVISLYRGEFEGPGGERFQRDIVRHPGAVAVVAIDGDDLFLVRQYRACLDADLWEIPAGKRDVDGEPPETTAGRELEEEVGMSAASIEPLLTIHHSPGFCDELGHIFLATDLTAVPRRSEGPEEQEMEVARVPIGEAVAMATDGRITDAKSIAAILAVARTLGR
ncbi:MAG: NUDIX hydrolase [Acidimicrobiia bacterium]|nr:NUDIX hydrolase [Acidimicrobiia bacterium]